MCGDTTRLEVDHIDPSTKVLNPFEVWTRKKESRDAELAKCQVLCHICHSKKTAADRRWVRAFDLEIYQSWKQSR